MTGRRGGGANRLEKERDKLIQDRLQVLLSTLLRDDDNKYCVDCDAKGPRWASWNIGIFLCIRCAGIHRNLGVHISKVKSVNLDSWTPAQVASMQSMGNSRARAVYEANLPEDFRRPQTESSLETFIRAKYEKKKYIAKEWVPSKPPDFPEGWTKLIEAEKQKKDIKQIRLPSHTLPPPPEPSTQASSSSNNSTPRPTTTTTTTTTGSSSQDLLALNTPANASLNNLVSTQQQANPSSNVDLIGIVDSVPQDNSFDAFAPSGNNDNTSSSSNDLKKSEDDFFNTPVTSNKSNSDKKMSNDSIMALFSQSGNTNNNAFGNPQNFMPNFNPQQQKQVPGNMISTFGSSQPGFNMVPNNTNPVSPFMATGSMSNPLGPQDTGANKVLNQFNGLNLGASSNGSNGIGNLLPNPLAPPAAKTDSLDNLDMWAGF